MRIALVGCLLLVLPGCIFCRGQESVANAELIEQRAALVRDYRTCLHENSTNAQKQRDCSVYNEQRHQVDISADPAVPRGAR
jgi:hypothetical protein